MVAAPRACIAASRSRFDDARRGELRSHAIAGFDFRSKVSTHLVTAMSELQLQAILWTAIIACWALHWWLGRDR